jgi:hypothetical protein
VINRITLDETSWVEYVTGWLPGPDADELLAKLTANAAWEQRERRMVNRVVIEPRLTAEYNDLADAPDPALLQSAIRLTEETSQAVVTGVVTGGEGVRVVGAQHPQEVGQQLLERGGRARRVSRHAPPRRQVVTGGEGLGVVRA